MGRFIFGLSLLSIAAAALLIGSAVSFFRSEFPDVGRLKSQYPAVHYRGPDQDPLVTLQRSRPRDWTPLGEISRAAVGAIVVSEDWAFYQHHGYDANQIKEAIKEDWEEHRFARGASTITQQVVRNVFLDQDKNLWRKLKELYLAIRLEDAVGKRKILETYLNIAEWGQGIYGIGPAARFYFHKSPAELNAKEGAFLAMLLPSPRRYSQSFRRKALTDYARETVGDILVKMTQAHYITQDEKAAQEMTPLSFERGARADLEPAEIEPEPEPGLEAPEPAASDLPGASAM